LKIAWISDTGNNNVHRNETEHDGPALGLPKLREVDLKTGGKHQQQFAQVRKAIHDRPLVAKEAKTIGSDDEPAEHKPHDAREADPAR